MPTSESASFSAPVAQTNNPNVAGSLASKKIRFGPFGRYAVFAAHTRFDAVEWMVADAEKVDEVTEGPAVIRQGATFDEVVEGVDDSHDDDQNGRGATRLNSFAKRT